MRRCPATTIALVGGPRRTRAPQTPNICNIALIVERCKPVPTSPVMMYLLFSMPSRGAKSKQPQSGETPVSQTNKKQKAATTAAKHVWAPPAPTGLDPRRNDPRWSGYVAPSDRPKPTPAVETKQAEADPNLPFLRLFPSSIRWTPDCSGSIRNPGTGAAIDLSSISDMEQLFLVMTSPGRLMQRAMSALDLDRLHLPLIAVGEACKLRSLSAKERPYLAKPLIRTVSPTPDFKLKLVHNKFSLTQSLLVVPILTEAEDLEYANIGRVAYGAKYFDTNEWHEKRTYWICDGATRLAICKEYARCFLYVSLSPTAV